MSYFSVFDISAAGMSVQKTRVDVVAINLANSETTKTASGGAYKPLQVIINEAIGADRFSNMVSNHAIAKQFLGSEVSQVRETQDPIKLVHKPSHPDADQNGMVEYPNIDPVSEMVNLLEATRAYEANVKVINAGSVIAQAALEI